MGENLLILETVTTKEAQPQKPPWRNVNLVHDKTWAKNTGVPTITPSYFWEVILLLTGTNIVWNLDTSGP